jgi:hypothetical protein
VQVPYVYENKDTGASYKYMLDIPQYNRPFKMKCLYGTIYIVPRSLDGMNLCGYYVYTNRRGWTTGWMHSKRKRDMLEFFLADLFKSAGFTPRNNLPAPSIKYPTAYAQFPADIGQVLRERGKLNGVEAFQIQGEK